MNDITIACGVCGEPVEVAKLRDHYASRHPVVLAQTSGAYDADVPTCIDCGAEVEAWLPTVEVRPVLRLEGVKGARVLVVGDAEDGADDGEIDVRCSSCHTVQEIDFDELRIE